MCDSSKGCRTACCHWEGSPCENLRWTDKAKGIGVCSIYDTRFGIRKTVDGKEFRCVPASTWIKHVLPPVLCGYYNVIHVEGIPTVRGLA